MRTEKAIQDVKKLMTKCQETGEDWDLAFCEWRSSPAIQGVSTAQLFFGRQIRSCVLPQLLEIPDTQKDARDRKFNKEENRFKRVTKHPLPPLHRDQKIWLRDRMTKRWDIPGRKKGARPHGRSYILQTSQGGVFLRNRRFIKPREEEEQEQEEEQEKNKEASGVKKVQREPTVLTQEPARGPALRKAGGAGQMNQEGRPALGAGGAGLG